MKTKPFLAETTCPKTPPRRLGTQMLRLSVALALTVASVASAQSYKVLRSFGMITNISGCHPLAPLVQGPDGTLYGTASSGQQSVAGTVFALNSDGTEFRVLKWFTNSLEGDSPWGGLVLSGGTLYGTTYRGGSSNKGVVFKVNTDGSGFAVLKNFTGDDGSNPQAGLILGGSTLYGTTEYGGSSGYGVVFKMNTDGSGYVVLESFTYTDGAWPYAGLVLAGSTLYGTTEYGGNLGQGVVFEVNTDGSGYTVLKSLWDKDGARPRGGLVLSGGTLYGTTSAGGDSFLGVVFKVNTDGSGYMVLKSFTGGDGTEPHASLVLAGSTLYGTTYYGGNSYAPGDNSQGYGVVFKLNTDGAGFAVLKNFTDSDGVHPNAGLVLAGSTLYGTTEQGGTSGDGVVFEVNTDGSGYAVLKSLPGGDGWSPEPGLVLAGTTLYGTTSAGGSSDAGLVFKMNTDGSGYAVLKSFTGSDGWSPGPGLVLAGSTLYGTTASGGTSGYGVVFKVNTDGSGFATLKNFTGSDGCYPRGELVLSGNTLYGTTSHGGGSYNLTNYGYGVVFKVNTDGSGFAVLKNFTGSDGIYPNAGLVLAGSTLYGTTEYGGSSNMGEVFKLNTDGSGFALLKSFSGGSDGFWPWAGLILGGSTLYGTTPYGGSSYNPTNTCCGPASAGEVFKVNTDGSGFAVLRSFGVTSGIDGAQPGTGLILAGSTLYGTTSGGGVTGASGAPCGVVFKVKTDGSGYALLKCFTNPDGMPGGGLILSGGTLYGTTAEGGSSFTGANSGYGVVFSLSLSPQLALVPSAGSVILKWPTNAIGFTLQSTTNLGSTAVWTSNSPAPAVVSGQYAVTNPITGTQQFYRLSQ